MEKYTLQMPQENKQIKDHEKKWYVGTEEDESLYLRPSMEILDSTGWGESENVGYWETYEEALKAKENYEKKQSECELVFPAYYMHIGEGTGHGDILYCKTKDDCRLIHTLYSAEGLQIEVNNWSEMKYISDKYAEGFGLTEHLQKYTVKDFFTEDVLKSFKENGMFNEFGKMNAHAIQQERESDYGDAKESFNSIANFWSNYLSRKTQLNVQLDAIDVALMMNLFKISRNAYKRKEDNFVDGESYANFGTRFFEENYETIS